MNAEQKTFRDFFGKDIKVGDRVLHLWAAVFLHGIKGGESAIKHKQAKVIGFSPKGVRIEWKDKGIPKKSIVFNTRNRIIILKNNVPEIDEESIANEAIKRYEAYKKGMLTRITNLRRDIARRDEQIEGLSKAFLSQKDEIKDLNIALQSMRSDIYRFELVDFDD